MADPQNTRRIEENGLCEKPGPCPCDAPCLQWSGQDRLAALPPDDAAASARGKASAEAIAAFEARVKETSGSTAALLRVWLRQGGLVPWQPAAELSRAARFVEGSEA